MVLTACSDISVSFALTLSVWTVFEEAVTSIKRGGSEGKSPQAGAGLHNIHMAERLISIGMNPVEY
jgi:hypothetical protein